MEELGHGGYSENWREKILEAGIKGYENFWKNEVEGRGRVNRPEAGTQNVRRWKKLVGKTNWFQPKDQVEEPGNHRSHSSHSQGQKKEVRKDSVKVESVLYCKYTPNSELKKELQTLEDRLLKDKKTGRIRVLERLGPSIKDLLSNPTPWKQSHCGRQDCWPCQTKEGSCRAKNCTYQISCLECRQEDRKTVYLGETHRTLWDRIREHQESLRQKSESSCLSRHWEDYHGGKTPKYEVKVLKTFKSATERQVSEALAIESGEYDLLLNSKTEFGRNAIAVQNTRFGDRLWEQRDREPDPGDRSGQSGQSDRSAEQGTKRTGDSSKTPETNQIENDDRDFLNQYSQRRKKQRTERQQEATENSAVWKSRRSQSNSKMASSTTFRNLNTLNTSDNARN